MSRRRSSKPPFEIMSHLTAGGSATPLRDPVTVSKQAQSQDSEGVAGTWWARAKYPVVLRVPRGYMALGGILLVAVLVLAYTVGHSRGIREGTAATHARYEAERTTPQGRMVTAENDDEQGHETTGVQRQQQEPPLFSRPHAHDPRQVGLNYYVLATDDEAGARRLLGFLWDRGINAAAFQHPDGRRFRVFALDRGFTREELRADEHREYERSLQRIGAEWAQQPGGIDFVRLGMSPERYDGEKVARIIVRDDR